MLICFDPGHGGNDPGAVASDGTCEWDATAITTLEAWGGTFTSDLVNAATITNLKIGAGATVNLANPVTTYTNLTNLGGTLSLPLEP